MTQEARTWILLLFSTIHASTDHILFASIWAVLAILSLIAQWREEHGE